MIKKIQFILLIFLISCEYISSPDNKSVKSQFGIYFLKDEELKISDICDIPINELQQKNNPWISEKDIDFYDWSSHCIYLNKTKSNFIKGWEEGNIYNTFPKKFADKPFIVKADNKTCYSGYFSQADLSNEYYTYPVIEDLGINSIYPDNVLIIEWIYLFHESPLNNDDVKNILIDSDIFHGGIKINFDQDDTNTIKIIENSDTSTISYKFTITNNDIDDLYIIDPDKTGSDLFHYFTNGPVFQNIETNELYEARRRKRINLPSLDYWSQSWYSKIESGKTIERTVVLKGYPKFKSGEYLFEFKYNGQNIGIDKHKDSLSDGRFWLGPTRSNVITIQYNP